MDMTQLSCFIAVADCLNFAKAAETLHLSQSAVSKRIKTLELELSTPLFERSTRQVRLTDAGRIFYPHAKNLLVHEKNIINSLAEMEASQAKPIFIGSYSMEIYTYIDQVFRNNCQKNPLVRPDVILSSIQPLNSCLETNAIDLIVGRKEMLEDIGLKAESYKELAPAPLKLVYSSMIQYQEQEDFVSKKITPASIQRCLGLEKLILCDELESVYMRYPELTNILFAYSQNTIHCNNLESATSLTKAGLGFMILPLPDAIERECLTYIKIKNMAPFSYGYFFCKSNISDGLALFTNELEAFFT